MTNIQKPTHGGYPDAERNSREHKRRSLWDLMHGSNTPRMHAPICNIRCGMLAQGCNCGFAPILPPIERDESMDRTYIPLPGGWEVQTKGKGSSFRICNTKTGDRYIVADGRLHAIIEQMARDAHEASK